MPPPSILSKSAQPVVRRKRFAWRCSSRNLPLCQAETGAIFSPASLHQRARGVDARLVQLLDVACEYGREEPMKSTSLAVGRSTGRVRSWACLRPRRA
eukprot:scaffold70974_cov63-Phaeocystis_antarctica.AAC.4